MILETGAYDLWEVSREPEDNGDIILVASESNACTKDEEQDKISLTLKGHQIYS